MYFFISYLTIFPDEVGKKLKDTLANVLHDVH